MADSDTFKYLSNAQSSNAATEFLQKQLGKNKYTSGDPYAYGEGATPGGEGYRDQLKVTNQDEIDQWHKDNPDGGKGGGNGDWSGSGLSGAPLERYKKGMWGAGRMSVEELRKKFNLSDDESAASGERAIYGTNSDGSQVFIGAVTGDLKGNSELIGAHGRQNLGGEADHSGDALSSDGDVKGAILNLWKAEAGEAETGPKPEFEMKPIEHSPEIKQAKERVKNYEQDVMSGKTSKEIYGKGEAMASDKYKFDASLGAAAIGGSPLNAESQAKAAVSFLDNKVADVKKKMSLDLQ